MIHLSEMLRNSSYALYSMILCDNGCPKTIGCVEPKLLAAKANIVNGSIQEQNELIAAISLVYQQLCHSIFADVYTDVCVVILGQLFFPLC